MTTLDNLFVRLHRWASRQDENFTTEVFVYILKYLQVNEKALFLSLVSNLTGKLLEPNINEIDEIEITTQVHNKDTIQDVQLRTPDKLIFIEVKVGATLGRSQVTAYLDLLKNNQYQIENTLLVCLTRSPISSDITDGAFPVRWYQIVKWLEQGIESVHGAASKYLISNFLEFLAYQKATLTKVSSPVSDGVSKYRNKAGDNSIFHKRFKNLDKLLVEDELKPFHDLMLLIFDALKAVAGEEKITFDSSNDISGDGEAFFSINSGEYSIALQYDTPEVLRFSTYNRVADKEKNDLKLGRIYYEKKYKRFRWRNEVPLPMDFISLDRQEQLRVLTMIVSENIQYAESVTYLRDKKS